MPLIKVVLFINKLPGIPEHRRESGSRRSRMARDTSRGEGECRVACCGLIVRRWGSIATEKGENWSCRLRRFPPQRHKGAQVLSRDGLHDVFRDGHRPYPSGVRRRWAALQQQRSRWRGRRGHSCPFDAAVALEGTRKPWGRSLPLHVAQRLRRERVDVST